MINVKPANGGIIVEIVSEQLPVRVVSSEYVRLDDIDALKQSIFDARRESMARAAALRPDRAHEELLRVTGNGDVVSVKDSKSWDGRDWHNMPRHDRFDPMRVA